MEDQKQKNQVKLLNKMNDFYKLFDEGKYSEFIKLYGKNSKFFKKNKSTKISTEEKMKFLACLSVSAKEMNNKCLLGKVNKILCKNIEKHKKNFNKRKGEMTETFQDLLDGEYEVVNNYDTIIDKVNNSKILNKMTETFMAIVEGYEIVEFPAENNNSNDKIKGRHTSNLTNELKDKKSWLSKIF